MGESHGCGIYQLRPSGAAAADPQSERRRRTQTCRRISTTKTIAAAAQSILQQVGVDKKEVTLATDRPSEDKVVFHNGMTGSVQLELSAPEVPGFTAKLEQSNVRAGGDVPVVFHYEPGDPAARRDPITVQLVVQPLNQAFAIRVNFAAAGPVTPK